MAIQNKVPFPQANDFEKIVRILNIDDESRLKNIDSMRRFLDDISDRQVSYYLSASEYVGIITKNREFTEIAKKLRTQNEYAQKIELIRLLISDPVFGTVYITEKILETPMEIEDVADIIRTYYPDYCDAIYIRRGQTVLSWINWIKTNMNE